MRTPPRSTARGAKKQLHLKKDPIAGKSRQKLQSSKSSSEPATGSPTNNIPSTEESSSREKSFPIVGIGASAGGLEAFTNLLEHLPPDTGMAFVLVQHLAPAKDSILSELLSKTTSMPVHEVQDGMTVEPDHIYVIPPNALMTVFHGAAPPSASPRTSYTVYAR